MKSNQPISKICTAGFSKKISTVKSILFRQNDVIGGTYHPILQVYCPSVFFFLFDIVSHQSHLAYSHVPIQNSQVGNARVVF